MNTDDYLQVKSAIEAISQSDFVYWGSNGVEYDVCIEDEYEKLDFDVLMKIAQTNFHPPEDYDPDDCSVRHAIEFSLREYCKIKNIGIVCDNCGNIDYQENDIVEFHGQVGRFVEQWGNVELTLRSLELMRNEDGSLSVQHKNLLWAERDELDFKGRVDLIFPKNEFKDIHRKLRNWSSFRNDLTHNPIVKTCDGQFQFEDVDRQAFRKSYHGGACQSGEMSIEFSKPRTINLRSLSEMSAEIGFTLRFFESLIAGLRERGPCARFAITKVTTKPSIEFEVTASCEHTPAHNLYFTYNGRTRHHIESTGWTSDLASLP